ncbi:hypothetical protein MSMTP_2855 [Methanosarcina sp. MTP4]|uniref:rolling circle replication-associated protein n=1 Tax=Methanosarcina sp. MTP4 TaxID=1434100 RepID=UPI000615BB11|nr:hypothetical protein [Methanosarcina sp. MTP4]AKB26324.1 hypothetical protein MSMTP_2855 [Methanosarcina sp. MTP4]
MAGLTKAQISDIWAETSEKPLSMKQITQNLGLDGKKGYLQVYNYFQTKKARSHFFMRKENSILWIQANPQNKLDLILDKQNSKKTKLVIGRHHSIPGVKRASPERMEAILKTTRCKGYGYTDKKTGKFIKTNNIKEENIKLFWNYINRVSKEKITYTRSTDGDPVFSSENVYLPYATRFTSKKRQLKIVEGYRGTWSNASKRYLIGVFLTLTADPKKHKSLWHCNYEMRKAWDRLRSLINTWFPKKVPWICIREFQENGRLHFHVVFFGINWLETKKKIQFFWTKYGGGYVMDIHAIRRTSDGWTWSRSCPLEAANQDPKTFLSEYLEKSMSPLFGMDYWLTGVQYWTASREIRATHKKKEKQGNWIFKGVKSPVTKFRASHRKDSNALYSSSLLKKKRVKTGTENGPETKLKVIQTDPPPHTEFRRASDLSCSAKRSYQHESRYT